jgi:hypothetical protein
MHSFEVKRKGETTIQVDSVTGDTTTIDAPDVNIELLRLTFNLSHNFAADSLRFSDLATTFRTPALKFMDLSGSANFTLYDEVKNANEQYVRVNQFLLSNGKGLARLTNVSMNVSTTFSANGIGSSSSLASSNISDSAATLDTADVDTTALGGRFLRSDVKDVDGDLFGTHSPGYSDFSMPWSINLGLNFNYSRPTLSMITRQLNLSTSFNVTIAESWKVSTTFQYDFINERFITPQINLTKDLHCWDLTATWYPIGYNRGFYLRFGIKAAQLRDLKIEKRDSPIFR